MRIEKLSKGKSKKIIVAIITLLFIMGIIYITNSKAKYQVTKSIQIVNGNVNYSLADLNVIALKVQDSKGSENYTLKDEVPSGSYEVNTNKSYCTIGSGTTQLKNIPMEYKDNKVYIGITKKGTKCYVYLDFKINASEVILSNRTTNIGQDGFTDIDKEEHIDGNKKSILYSDTDDLGTTYYFRGKVKDNWVKFGKNSLGQDIYWQIIRINGNGTIRMIYAGEGKPATSDGGYTTSGQSALINNSTNVKYNDNSDRVEYVGFEYQIDQKHGFGNTATKSNVLTVLNEWFDKNLKDEFNNGDGKIDSNVGFCNDRRNSTDKTTAWGSEDDEGGTGTTQTYYGAYLRLVSGGNDSSLTNKSIPTFKCKEIEKDYFTYKKSVGIPLSNQSTLEGTKSLEWPVGLITVDEVVYAGGLYNQENKDYYLYTTYGFWTMSPAFFDAISSHFSYVFIMSTGNGSIGDNAPVHTWGVRPVINLKSDVTISGKGTIDSPYEIS